MTAAIHATAATGFANASDSYERGRPKYPAEAVALLTGKFAITPGTTVVDVVYG